MKKRFLAFLILLTLLVFPALSESVPSASAPTVTDCGLDLAGSGVHYPQLSGMANAQLQESVNARILAEGHVETYLNRLPLLMQNPTGMTVDYDATLTGDIFSCVLSAEGALTEGRPTHVWHTLNIDLTTGEDITLADLFLDPDAALEALTDYLDWTVSPALSAHLQNSSLTPLPEAFALSAAGLTLYYPIGQLSTLSDRAGAITVLWYELREHLRLGEGSVLRRIGAEAMVVAPAEGRRSVAEALSEGALPGIPVSLGGSVKDAVDAHRMLTDADLYQDGRMFALEDAAFRQVWLLTDALTEGWEHSVISGIRADRFNLCGLYPGLSWPQVSAILGQPDAEVALDPEQAEAYRLETGVSRYYSLGAVRLRLHFDEAEALTSLFLFPTQ